MYEQALAIWTATSDKIDIAETQLGLADLSLEEARSPVEQEAAVDRSSRFFRSRKPATTKPRLGASSPRAACGRKADAAREALQHARTLAAKSQNPAIRWQTAIVAARIETVRNDVARSASATTTRKELTAIIAKSRELGYQGIELDARLALATLEMKAGQSDTGRAHLSVIEADAKAKGYNLIARKAALARG